MCERFVELLRRWSGRARAFVEAVATPEPNEANCSDAAGRDPDGPVLPILAASFQQKDSSMRALLSSAFLAAAAILAAAPVAASDYDAISIGVSTDDLDLTDASDLARLNARVNRAAAQACAAGSMGGVAGQRATGACRAQAVDAARARVGRVAASISGGSSRIAARR